jgi:hypothetical protein
VSALPPQSVDTTGAAKGGGVPNKQKLCLLVASLYGSGGQEVLLGLSRAEQIGLYTRFKLLQRIYLVAACMHATCPADRSSKDGNSEPVSLARRNCRVQVNRSKAIPVTGRGGL